LFTSEDDIFTVKDPVLPGITSTSLIIPSLVAGVNDPLVTRVTNNEVPPLLK